jgi:hypothetical protein
MINVHAFDSQSHVEELMNFISNTSAEIGACVTSLSAVRKNE